MANYEGTTRTNYFRVTDEERYKELVKNFACDTDDVHHYAKNKDGKIFHMFGAYGRIDYVSDDNELCSLSDAFYPELQRILPEGEAFILQEVGHEKLRYVNGRADIVTKDTVKYVDLATAIMQKAKELLGKEFETELEY